MNPVSRVAAYIAAHTHNGLTDTLSATYTLNGSLVAITATDIEAILGELTDANTRNQALTADLARLTATYANTLSRNGELTALAMVGAL